MIDHGTERPKVNTVPVAVECKEIARSTLHLDCIANSLLVGEVICHKCLDALSNRFRAAHLNRGERPTKTENLGIALDGI